MGGGSMAMKSVLAECHIGLGTLALYRTHLWEASLLKMWECIGAAPYIDSLSLEKKKLDFFERIIKSAG